MSKSAKFLNPDGESTPVKAIGRESFFFRFVIHFKWQRRLAFQYSISLFQGSTSTRPSSWMVTTKTNMSSLPSAPGETFFALSSRTRTKSFHLAMASVLAGLTPSSWPPELQMTWYFISPLIPLRFMAPASLSAAVFRMAFRMPTVYLFFLIAVALTSSVSGSWRPFSLREDLYFSTKADVKVSRAPSSLCHCLCTRGDPLFTRAHASAALNATQPKILA
mmetsp:Transcript_6183/g.12980  ORF Transcript_6183/g.12980 Transcript_6183/m.12980 type:complete len:220 (-) Transcript_6183:1173-1832(-)